MTLIVSSAWERTAADLGKMKADVRLTAPFKMLVVTPTDTFPDLNVQETCQKAADDETDAQLCLDQTDCGSCVDTTLSDGMTTCQWFKDGEYCGSGCDMTGCGETTCDVTEGGPCDDLDCVECLETDGCAWVPVEGCLNSCDMIADTACFPSDKYSASDVCDETGGDMTGGEDTEATSPPTSGASGESGSTTSIVVAMVVVITSGAL
jgi:hypothetical protein